MQRDKERLAGGSRQAAADGLKLSSDLAVYQKWTDSLQKEKEVWPLTASRPLMNEDGCEDTATDPPQPCKL